MKNIDNEEFNKKIIARAIKETAFRKELMKDPKAVLKRELGFTCPPDLSIEVKEQPADKRYIVLPTLPKAASLSEAELQGVAGGVAGTSIVHFQGRCTALFKW